VTLTAIWNFKATPIYRAGAQILIETTDPKVVAMAKENMPDDTELLSEAEYLRVFKIIDELVAKKNAASSGTAPGADQKKFPF